MPINLNDYNNLQGKELKSNKELLDYMDDNQAYSTTDIEKFLGIQHPAALQRLKRLARDKFIELKKDGKKHWWHKIKEWPKQEDTIISDTLDSRYYKVEKPRPT